ncbi:MAG: hypothetical protein ACRD2U_02925, partial [Terriglobales bacterium]
MKVANGDPLDINDGIALLPAAGYALRRCARITGLLRERACFAAGTLLLTRSGYKPIEQFKAGDDILSRPEASPD